MGLLGCSEKKSELGHIMDSAVTMEMKSDESSHKSEKMSYQEAPPPPPPPPSVSLFEKTNTQKKIIHTADIRFKVEDLKKAESAIKVRVKALNGYISNENQNRYN